MMDSTLPQWQWIGWRPWMWKLRTSMETGCAPRADVGPVPAKVPGSVQWALRQEGLLPDWNLGLNSLACEWVEHRHWELLTRVPKDRFRGQRRVTLEAEGLDYWGWVLVDGREIASFRGALIPHSFDLTPHLTDGEDHFLSILFDCPPPEQGQIGYTSASQYFKPRYNYSWDWCPRVVPVGVVGNLCCKAGLEAELSLDKVLCFLDEDLRNGSLWVHLSHQGSDEVELRLGLKDGSMEVAGMEMKMGPGKREVLWENLPVEPWWPNGLGQAKTYELEVRARDASGSDWMRSCQVGFKTVRWLPCEGSPSDSLPWLCEVNGKTLFLQGVNWSPAKVDYPDTTREDLDALVGLYKDMGCTLFRVWGGAYLETEPFYELCDRAGILVWQEFPLSSSGVDNWPPESGPVIGDLVRIARSYIHRRAHHPSLLMWCGGNELQGDEKGGRTGGGLPTPPEHPCLKALAEVVRQEDPGRRFVHTSSSGPSFYAHEENFGKGVHHDVHGPWGWGQRDMEAWKRYWSMDDALFRSEVGMPGASPLRLIKKYAGKNPLWPVGNLLWLHTSSWWIRPELYSDLLCLEAQQGLREYVNTTRKEQAKAYAIAAKACKARFPRCGGFLVWMGHDCFPCAMNNSIIDFERNPKPAYHSLKRVFRGKTR